MTLSNNIDLVLAALVIEAVFGYPRALYRVIGHPVTWIGALIGTLDRALNRATWSAATRRRTGVVALCILVGATFFVAFALVQHAPGSPWSLALLAPLASTLLAQRSLYTHVRDVARALDANGLQAGRDTVARIVGRDTQALDEAGVCRAAIESLAENFSDGIVAPAFWMIVAGLPGAVLYKAINTADSMIGHLDARHAAFGWASARLDDLVNLPASRLSALWIAAAAIIVPGASAHAAWTAVWRDARKHRSPNAGWPEAAMAGALGLKLAGPRTYGGALVQDAFMGEGRRQADARDIRRALRLYLAACLVQALAIVVLGVALIAP